MDKQTKKETSNYERQVLNFNFGILEKTLPEYNSKRLAENIKLIAKSLTKNDLFYTINLIYAYLNDTRQLRYFDVCCDLIKIFFLTGKENFYMILNFLVNPKQFINSYFIEGFISKYYRAVYLEDNDLARSYFQLIKNISNISNDFKVYFSNHLANMESTMKRFPQDSQIKLEEVMLSARSDAKRKNSISVKKVAYDKLYTVIKYKIGKLKAFGGCTIITDIDDFDVNSIFSYLSKIEGVTFKLLYCPQKSIFIKTYKKDNMDLKSLYESYNVTKKTKDYFRCSEILSEIINYTDNPTPQLYANLAYYYIKLKSIDVALKYYKLADSLNISETGEEKYSNIITMLENACDDPLKSFNIDINIDDIMLSNNVDNNIIEQVRFLMRERKVDLDSVLYYLNMSLKQEVIIKLILIKDYLLEGKRQIAEKMLIDIKDDAYQFSDLQDIFDKLFENRELIRLEGRNNRRKILRNDH